MKFTMIAGIHIAPLLAERSLITVSLEHVSYVRWYTRYA